MPMSKTSLALRIVSSGIACLALLAATAQPLAPRATPAKSPFPSVKRAWVNVETADGRKLLTTVIRPPSKGPSPAVVLLHGGEGLDETYLDIGAEIAKSGFVVVVGCWQKTNYVCADAPLTSDWVADPGAHCGRELVEYARSLSGVDPDRIGIYAFSRGGHAALWAASTGAPVKAVVADSPAHEPAAYNIYPPPPRPDTVLDGLTVPVLIMHGTADNVISVDQSRAYEKAARERGKPVEAVYIDGGRHMLGRSSAEPRQRAISFFRAQLGL
jgi:dienelactone hydrolase